MSEEENRPVHNSCMPIGVIHSEHTVPEKTPIQPVYAQSCSGRVDVFPEYAEGINDLESFPHLILLNHFHQSVAPKLTVRPLNDNVSRGVFSTRHSKRPIPIGMSVVHLIRRYGTAPYLEDLNILDGTPLLDIKPYLSRFNQVANVHGGWTDSVDESTARRRGRRGYLRNNRHQTEGI